MTKTGLVLEGGGMRGIYTAGVLDVFLDHNITVDGVIGVSAGAIHGASFLSKQRGRNIAYSLEYRNNKEYMSLKSLLKTGNLFGVDFVMIDCRMNYTNSTMMHLRRIQRDFMYAVQM